MNNIYDDARFRLLTAALNWTAIPLRLCAWGGTPGFVPTDKMTSDITFRTPMLGYSLAVTQQGVSPDGTAQTNHVVIPNVPIGPDITWFTMVEHVSSTVNARLILYIDDAVELPFTPNGLDVVVQADWLAERGWFRP